MGGVGPDGDGEFVVLNLSADVFAKHGADVAGDAAGQAGMWLLVPHCDVDQFQKYTSPIRRNGAPEGLIGDSSFGFPPEEE